MAPKDLNLQNLCDTDDVENLIKEPTGIKE